MATSACRNRQALRLLQRIVIPHEFGLSHKPGKVSGDEGQQEHDYEYRYHEKSSPGAIFLLPRFVLRPLKMLDVIGVARP